MAALIAHIDLVAVKWQHEKAFERPQSAVGCELANYKLVRIEDPVKE